ncbi:hypothetical protein AB1Y20_005161 [Prymnesium parvum]|uniref:Major facilitator superfamily (MFS) profile domain-containing protein n=1 Tax=Prymnesium parvum TaxID=97485 RepID=A0AB34J3I6_PRYPA
MNSPASSTLLREPLLRSCTPQRLAVRTRASRPRLPKLSGSPTVEQEEKPPSIFSLPRELLVVLAVDFLNSYRSFGFRSVQYQYLVDEFGFTDMETASLLGVQAWLLVIFGMIGAMLVDAWGVRTTAIVALTVSSVSRAMITFGEDKFTLQLALVGLAPFGEAVLSTGIYTVALKKLTTPKTRGLAFGVQYAVFNLAGAMADLVADAVRREDFRVPSWTPAWLWAHQSCSGLRVHVFITLLAVVLALLVCTLFLFDSVVVPIDEPPLKLFTGASSPIPMTFAELNALRDNATDAQRRRGFVVARVQHNRPPPEEAPVAPSPIFGRLNLERLQTATSPAAWLDAAVAACRRAAGSISELLALRSFWVALWFSLCLFFISKQWGDMDQLLPPFLERHYGVNVPIYAIHSINMWVCMLAPSPIAALTTHLEDFVVILPGLWVMALAPLWLACEPSIPAVIGWVFAASIGEVIWSPRQSAWIASIAPDGREGVFLAMLSLKSLVTTIPSTTLNGWLNSVFNANCPSCRNEWGHFCDKQVKLNASAFACHAGGSLCLGGRYGEGLLSHNASELVCPSNCVQCPGYDDSAQVMWITVFVFSIISPVMVQLSLPYLRSVETKEQRTKTVPH